MQKHAPKRLITDDFGFDGKAVLRRKSYIGYTHLFYLYPYRKKTSYRDDLLTEKEQIADHKYSLSCPEFVSICKAIFKIAIKNILIQGGKWELPSNMGHIKLAKRKSYRTIDWEKTNRFNNEIRKEDEEKRTIKFNAVSTSGYLVRVVWRNAYFTDRSVWSFRLAKQTFTQVIVDKLNNNPSIIHRFDDWNPFN